jgi:SAM-dependent methyltransferase
MEPILGQRYAEFGTAHYYISGDRAKAREIIMNSILPGARMITVPCLCGNCQGTDKGLAGIDRWGLPARSVLCGHCGLIRVDPRWDDETYARIYRGYFWPLQIGFFNITRERFDLSLRRAAPFAQFLTSHINLKGKNLLEIGCSYGAGLASLKETGANLTGYDYDERCLNFGRTFTGLDLRLGGIKEAVKERKQYEVVVLRHVLEHFLNPLEECLKLHSLLKEKGVLLVEVPGVFNQEDVGNDPLMYFNAFHTFSFDLSTLTCLMNACSFSRIAGDEKVNSLWSKGEEGKEVVWQNPKHADEILSLFLSAEEKFKELKSNVFINKGKSFLHRLKSLLRS